MKTQGAPLCLLLVVTLAIIGCPAPLGSPDTAAPMGGLVINNGADYAASVDVTLTLFAEDNGGTSGLQMLISNLADFAGANWEAFSASCAWTVTAGNGCKTVYAKFRDTAGNESIVYSDEIILDDTAPEAPSTPDMDPTDDSGCLDDDNITNIIKDLTFSGNNAEPGCPVRLYEEATLLGAGTADESGSWTIVIDLDPGTHYIVARAVDGAGHESPSSGVLTVVIDTTPPSGAPAFIKPANCVNTGINRRPVFTWTGVSQAAGYELQADDNFDFTSPEYAWADIPGTTFTPAADMAVSAAAPVGTRYHLRIRATDSAGNIGVWSENSRYINVGRFDADFNGDGFSDAVVGASGYNGKQGRAYIYLGGQAMNAVADVILTGEAVNSKFGYSVASAGDLNNDGYADVIVGAIGYTDTTSRVFIYFGGQAMDATADVILTGEPVNCDFGYSVASAGDLNNDGYADVIVGAPGYNGQQGRADVFWGAKTMDSTADLTLTGETANTSFGISVATAGDVNNDGFSDIIVGACNYKPGIFQGRTYIYYGGEAKDNVADVIITGEPSSNSGHFVSTAGDVNGDGYADVIVGADGYNDGQGRAFIYYGGFAMDNTADVTMTGEAGQRSFFGLKAAPAGDINNDGYNDVIVGALGYNLNQGSAYIFFGGQAMDGTADVTISGETIENLFGTSVAFVGETNKNDG